MLTEKNGHRVKLGLALVKRGDKADGDKIPMISNRHLPPAEPLQLQIIASMLFPSTNLFSFLQPFSPFPFPTFKPYLIIIMPLPTIPTHNVAAHNTEDSCFITLGSKVYDITNFLGDHPGGGDLIVEYGGKDVTTIMRDELSHFHSEAAYEILDQHLVGYVANEKIIEAVVEHDKPDDIVPLQPNADGMAALKANGVAGEITQRKQVFAATGMSDASDLTKETDLDADYKTHKFLDLNKPLLMQVWNGGFSKDFYLEQVHRPRYYTGGDSAPLFGNFLEPLSKTAWWVIPIVWLPPVTTGSYIAYTGLPSFFETAAYWLLGLFLWSLVEYGLHRGLFHVDK